MFNLFKNKSSQTCPSPVEHDALVKLRKLQQERDSLRGFFDNGRKTKQEITQTVSKFAERIAYHCAHTEFSDSYSHLAGYIDSLSRIRDRDRDEYFKHLIVIALKKAMVDIDIGEVIQELNRLEEYVSSANVKSERFKLVETEIQSIKQSIGIAD